MNISSIPIALTQGSPEWLQHRANCLNASDLAAAMGVSKYTTRAELIKRLATGITPEVDAATQARFDKGHANEAAAAPLAEEAIGEGLYPMVLAAEVPGLTRRLSASFDGLTLMLEKSWENKFPNAALVASLQAGVIPAEYHPQMEQGLMLSGAEKCLFTAGEVASMWYHSNPELRAKIIPTWKQVEADVLAYVPSDAKEMPPAKVSIALPALFIHAKGEITTSNMEEYGKALTDKLKEVRAIVLLTDQDFSNAKASAKLLRDNIESARAAKDAMLEQTVSVGEAARMIEAWCEDMRVTALALEKKVEQEDLKKKAAMIAAARTAYDAHIEACKEVTGGPWRSIMAPDWAGAIKGKRNYTSMQDALDTALAAGKIEADTSARNIRAALTALDEESKGFEHLFADRLSFISKSPEDVRLLARARITQEQKRVEEATERERERIRAEEQAKAEREARARLEQEQRARIDQEARDRLAADAAAKAMAQPTPAQADQDVLRQAIVSGVSITRTVMQADGSRDVEHIPLSAVYQDSQVTNVLPMPTKAPAVDTSARIKLGELNARIAPLSITADGLESLGFPVVETDKNAKLYRLADVPSILAALVAHIQAVQAKAAA